MDNYLTIGARDFDQSVAFYDALLSTVGWASHMSFPGWRAYSREGKGEGLTVWVCLPYNGEPATAGNGSMVAFRANSAAEVDAFHAAALAHGGSDEGAPGPRPDYGPTWYGAYARDPIGNKISAYFNG